MLSLVEIEQLVAANRRSLDQREGQKQLLENQHTALAIQIEDLTKISEAAVEARVLLETLTDAKRELVREKIEALVTTGIQAIFGPAYEFRIEQGSARGLVTFEYKILHAFKGEKHSSDLRGFHGGGLVALVGFLLRVVMVLFVRPAKRRLIILDETMAALDGDKRAPFSALLKTLASQLDMQFIMISHAPEFATDADIAYEVRQEQQGVATLHRL